MKTFIFRVFFLDIPLDVAVDRLGQRSVDPITGDRFHTHDHPAPTYPIQQRSLQHPTDTNEMIAKRYQAYSIYFPELEEFYAQENAIHIPADQDAFTIFEAVEAGIVNPITHDGY